MKKTIIAVALMATLGGGWYWYQQNDSQSETSAPTAQRSGRQGGGAVFVTTGIVEQQPLSQSLKLIGSLRARDEVDIASEVTGKITAITVTHNQQVNAGDVLVKLDDRRAQASHREASAYLRDEQRKLKELKTLVNRGAVTQTQVDAQNAAVDIAGARLVTAKKAVDDHTLVAPFDGTVGLVDISLGQLVNASQTLLSLDNLKVMEVDLSVPETYLSQLSKGMTVQAQSQAWGNTQFEGVVAAIDSRVQADSLNLRVRIEIDNPQGQLLPGMLMNVDMQFAPVSKPVVPVQGIEYAGTKRFVYVIDDEDKAHRTEIKLGARVGDQVMVESGLEGGERIVVQGLVNIRDQASVKDIHAEQVKGKQGRDSAAKARGE